jgi:hypothetical protein
MDGSMNVPAGPRRGSPQDVGSQAPTEDLTVGQRRGRSLSESHPPARQARIGNPAKDGDLRRFNRWLEDRRATCTNGGNMADRWIAEIRYRTGHSTNTPFEDFANLGALIEMDPNRDEIESITINRPPVEKTSGFSPWRT